MVLQLRLRRARPRRQARRPLRVEQLEARYVLDGSAVALVGDMFAVHQNGPQTTFNVLANDLFDANYGGARLITSASYGSEGGRIAIADDKRTILYTPPADFFGTETFVYAVDSQYTAQVQVSVQAPLAFDHFLIPPDGIQHPLDVLANDPFWSGYSGPRRITSVSVGSVGGTVAVAPGGQSILYTPPDEAFGKETFVYVVDDLYPAEVTIEIPKTLEGDSFEIIQHAPAQIFNVLANDPFWPGYTGERRITRVTDSQLGTVAISSDGRSIVYTPGSGNGWDSFSYVVDGTYEANVSVRVYRPVQDDSFEVDRNSTGYFYSVTLNDIYYDQNGYGHDIIDRVTSVTQPASGGSVTISADGKGILYSPPVGFFGNDTFTYLADGVHEATVSVNVTRPVRNDYISSGVYQDTPNAVLNVLANDFIGNGYTGPRLITAVGLTENGGVLTIRADGKAILYTPASGFTGNDSFSYTVDGDLQATATIYVRPLAQPDYYQFGPSPPHGPFTLNVLQNDFFGYGYSGPAVITAASFLGGDGQLSIQNGQTLSFQPTSAGSHVIRYTVDNKYETTVSIWIPSHINSDQFVIDENSSALVLDVMANDFIPDSPYAQFRSQDYTGPRRITGVTQSAHGGILTIAADGRTVSYQPPADYYGEDHFTYTVDNFMTATVGVQVIRRVRDDTFRVDAADGQQALPVLANDLFGANYAGPGQIIAVSTTSAGGTVTIAPDSRSILYTPQAGFAGTDTFTYTVDGALKAQVSVVVNAPANAQNPMFGSFDEYTQFLIDDALVRYQYLFSQVAWGTVLTGGFNTNDATPGGSTPDRNHSETNVQVAGVDEGDIIEFDSDYLYMLRDGEVVIVNAWPAEDLSIASQVDIEGRAIAEFLQGDRLTVISEVGGGYIVDPWLSGPVGGPVDSFWPYPIPTLPFSTIVTVLDVSDRAAPTVVQTTTMEGKYVDSRGVGDYVYVLVDNANAVAAEPQIIDDDNDPTTPGRYETREEYLSRVTANSGEFVEAALPNYSSYGPDGELVRAGLLNTPEGIHRPLVPEARNLISVVSFNVESNEPGLTDTSAIYSTGASAIYASLDNFYVFDTDHSSEDGAVTRIAKFDWEPATGGIEFAATTTVPGTILNQFSADENGSYLRIATTVANSYAGNWSGRAENMLFVLQEDGGVFEYVGSLQNLALDETMRSVRFLGDRAFVSTFQDVDPLFALDLSDPANPESVGRITLPGFTSYMHLIDESHLLTVGRNTPVGSSGPTQVAIFDISNLTQPLRTAEYTFARFSTSEAELDHHAFGYYAEFGLLGMPVRRSYVERVDLDGDGYRETRQTVEENELAVFTVDTTATDPSQRLVLAGEIAHDSPVRRSGYIGDKLYSIANDSVKVVDVSDPNTVIAEVIVDTGDELTPLPLLDNHNFTLSLTSTSDSSAPLTESQRLAAVVERARHDLADRLGSGPGAPLFVTAEATPNAPGGGYCLVFRAGDDYFLYRASRDGLIAFVQADYNFSGGAASAWHAVEFAVASSPAVIRGDMNLDGRVDDHDLAAWKASFGVVSLTAFHPADANRNGAVDAADYTLWRDNLGKVAGDYNGDGAATNEDYDFWKSNFGATSGPGLAADGNGDGIVNAADYTMWRDRMSSTAGAAALSHESESGSGSKANSSIAVERSNDSPRLAIATAQARDTVFATLPQLSVQKSTTVPRSSRSSSDHPWERTALLLLARSNASFQAEQNDGGVRFHRCDDSTSDTAGNTETATDAAFAAEWPGSVFAYRRHRLTAAAN